MEVRLVSLTQSLINIADNTTDRPLTPEELIVYIARVSNPSNQLNTETSEKLLRYLITNKHWSPFEMADMTVEIVTSRAIAAQILRHRSFSFQEFSQRYAEVTEIESVEFRQQAVKNRQSSTVVVGRVEQSDQDFIPFQSAHNLEEETDPSRISAINAWVVESAELLKQTSDHYKKGIGIGIAKESARMILPLTAQTRIYMKGSVRSWIHYLQVRVDHHVQLEHRNVAEQVLRIFEKEFPATYAALLSL